QTAATAGHGWRWRFCMRPAYELWTVHGGGGDGSTPAPQCGKHPNHAHGLCDPNRGCSISCQRLLTFRPPRSYFIIYKSEEKTKVSRLLHASITATDRGKRFASARGYRQPGDTKRIHPAGTPGGVLRAAGPFVAQSMYFVAGGFRLDDQPIPRLRVCLQVLLCTLHARVHGDAQWRGLRA